SSFALFMMIAAGVTPFALRRRTCGFTSAGKTLRTASEQVISLRDLATALSGTGGRPSKEQVAPAQP
ncbi:MAG: hypothetical protein ACJ74C_03215, partial [Gaiellaceae bacterium]